jgi:endonuclease/exonuclease/phosphatase family metal-dependent hydrolase
MAIRLRIMCWNIQAGDADSTRPEGEILPRIAEHIRAKSPDIVLLNEVRRRGFPWGVDQTAVLANSTGLPYYRFGVAVATGITGHKGMAVLSRFSLGPTRLHPVMRGSTATAYAILETSVMVDRLVHQLFSTRFDAHNRTDNVAAHQQAIDLVRRVNPSVPVIFGGDFNATRRTSQMHNFMANSGLTDAFSVLPDPSPCGPAEAEDRVDYVFYRGPYKVTLMEQRCPWPGEHPVSDHPWIVVGLEEILALRVDVMPAPLPFWKPVELTVSARDGRTGAPVLGRVLIGNAAVADTDTPFTYTFHGTAITGGVVSVPGYPDTSFAFPFYTLAQLQALVRGHAFGLWVGRVRGGGRYFGDTWRDWFAAKAGLGIPPDVHV